MDFLLDIIILKEDMKRIDLCEKTFGWGGERLSCNPPQYIAMKDIIFEQAFDKKYYNRIIGENLDDNAIVLSLKSDVISELEYVINSGKDIEKNKLLIFLRSLYELSMFYILLIREDENVKERHEIKLQDQIVREICKSLSWISSKDILLFKRQQ